ncbi:hypothetical protein [Emticicia sp. SJ17W-69]|uniref:hypothetical protein n=1 Tax=Emticicia sp. SJ17W-69 TaxID=3421657 RepID=UPI003EB8D2FF
MKKFWFLKGFAIVAAFIFIGGFAVMSLWNWLIPSIFGLTTITWVQALGLLVLSKILFGGFRGRGHCGGYGGGGHHFWKQRMAERMEKMSPEEKEHFRAKMKNRWGKWTEKSEE